jgi:hypothetical protein
MYSDGHGTNVQLNEVHGLVRAMSTDNQDHQVSSPSAYLLEDNGDVDGDHRNNVSAVTRHVARSVLINVVR